MTNIIKIILLFFIITNFLEANNKKITLQLSWFDQFQFAGYYMAKEKGFYKDFGLNVNIKPFEFGIDIPHEVSKGTFNFAVGRETLILERAKGQKIVALYALFQSSPLILLSTKESGINTVKDFRYKNIMTTIDDASEVSIKSMIISEKILIKDLNFIKHTHDINDLIDKKTDVISAYTSKSPYHLKKLGIEYNTFAPKDYGFDMYSDLLYTNEDHIKNDVETVIKFKQASLKGWMYAYNNINETVDYIYKNFNSQNLTKEELIFEALELKKLSFYQTKKLGDIRISKLQRIHDLYNIMGLLPKKIDLNEFIFDEDNFLNQLSTKEKEFIRDNSILKVAVKTDLKPLSYVDEIGLIKGVSNDFLSLISQKTGLKFVYVLRDSKDTLQTLKNDEVDLLASTLKDINAYKKTSAYFEVNELLFKRKDTNKNEIKKIGILNYINDNQRNLRTRDIYPKAETLIFDSIKQAVKALQNRDIDALFVSKELILFYMKENNITEIEYVNSQQRNIIQVSMLTKNNILNSILSKAINNINEEQRIAINNKWIPIMFEKKVDWTEIVQYLLIAIFVVLLIVYKQISLHKLTKKLKKSKDKLKAANKELKSLSQKDPLTNLFNRRYFENIVETILSIAKRENKPSCVLILDLDNFKQINDTYGHKIGDHVLCSLANTLTNISRKSDICARIGGEEFIVLLPNTTLVGAEVYAQSLREKIEKTPILIDDLKLNITTSIGVALFKDEESINDTIHRADKSLYKAKNEGKNKVIVNRD